MTGEQKDLFFLLRSALLCYGWVLLSGGDAEERGDVGVREEVRERPGGIDRGYWCEMCGCQIGQLCGSGALFGCVFLEGTDLLIGVNGQGGDDRMRQGCPGELREGEDVGFGVSELVVVVDSVEDVFRSMGKLLVQRICGGMGGAAGWRLTEVRVGPWRRLGGGEWMWVAVGVDKEVLGKRSQRPQVVDGKRKEVNSIPVEVCCGLGVPTKLGSCGLLMRPGCCLSDGLVVGRGKGWISLLWRRDRNINVHVVEWIVAVWLGQLESNVGRANVSVMFGGEPWGFDVDVVWSVDSFGFGGGMSEHRVEGVTNGVRQGCLGGSRAVEQVVTFWVQFPSCRATACGRGGGGIDGVGWKKGNS